MPTAALDPGRARSGARPAAKGGAGSRGRAPTPAPSKLAAAHAVGLRAPVAGAAAALLGVLILAAALATGGRGSEVMDISAAAGRVASQIASATPGLFSGNLDSLGWRVSQVRLRGATSAAQGEIFAAAAVRPGQSLTDLDLAAVRARVESVGWVAHAEVVRLLPNTLEISVVQRPLMAIWQHAGHNVVVASNGAVVNVVDPARFPALPLIVGEGANMAAAEVLPSLTARPTLMARLSALVRVDGRRWNLVLKDGGVVMLPAEDEEGALRRLDAFDAEGRILGLGLERIDLRDPEMTVLRPRGAQAPAVVQGGVIDGTD
jgi:cell division protein FtsQ